MMASVQSWEVAANYDYLKGKTVENWAKGWAWEFIRRSPEYQDTYTSFATLQTKHGGNWYKHQKAEHYYPPLHPNESVKEWRQRASDRLYVAEMLTKSKLTARQWNLAELYNPAQQYDAAVIRYAIPSNLNPMIYAHAVDTESVNVDELDYLSNDLQHLYGNGALVAVFDLNLPLLEQVQKYKKVHKELSTHRGGKIKLPYTHWQKLIRVLDAWDAGTTLPMAEIARRVGVPDNKNTIVNAAHDLKKQAIEMKNGGYRRILAKVRQLASE